MTFSYLGAFGAGILTFLSPCVLPLAPILIANVVSMKDPGRFDRLKATLWFCLGFSAVFILLGLSLPAATQVLGGAKPLLLAAGGLALILFGMRMMGMLGQGKLSFFLNKSLHLPDFVSRLPKGLQGLGFGAVFGLSWTPCVGPVLGGVLTYVASQQSSPLQGGLLLASFALGISLPLLGLAAGSEWLTPVFARLKAYLPKIEYAAGIGLFLFGAYIISQARLQDFSTRSAPELPLVAVDSNERKIRLDAAKQNSSRMVFFYSDHCPVCHAMETYLPEFEQSCSSSNFEVVRVNVDRAENSSVARHFGVRAVPTISFLNDRGAELIHLVGYQTQSRLRDGARTVANLSCAKVREVQSPSERVQDSVFPGDKSSCAVGARC